jgi:hypothetical protein
MAVLCEPSNPAGSHDQPTARKHTNTTGLCLRSPTPSLFYCSVLHVLALRNSGLATVATHCIRESQAKQ